MNSKILYRELGKASKAGDIDRMRAALDNGASPSGDIAYERFRPLPCACEGSQIEAVKLLLECGSDVNLRGGWVNSSPIFIASCNGDEEIVRLLITHGANSTKMDGGIWMSSAFAGACGGGHLGVVKEMVAHGAEVADKHRLELLNFLVGFPSPEKAEVARYLIGFGSRFISPEHIDWGLVRACEVGSPEMIEFFLEHGANIHAPIAQEEDDFIRAPFIRTPLLAAATYGRADLVPFLLSKGADLNESGRTGVSVIRRLVDLPDKDVRMAHGALALLREMGLNPLMRIGVKSLLGHFSESSKPEALEVIRDAQRLYRSESMIESINSAMGGEEESQVPSYSKAEDPL